VPTSQGIKDYDTKPGAPAAPKRLLVKITTTQVAAGAATLSRREGYTEGATKA